MIESGGLLSDVELIKTSFITEIIKTPFIIKNESCHHPVVLKFEYKSAEADGKSRRVV